MTRRLALAASLLALACGQEPTRPAGTGGEPTGGPDVSPPAIKFIAPSHDTSFHSVTHVDVLVQLTDESAVSSIVASVSGGVNFGFPNAVGMPAPWLQISFPIPVSGRTSNAIVFTVNAVDTRGNSTSSTLRFNVE